MAEKNVGSCALACDIMPFPVAITCPSLSSRDICKKSSSSDPLVLVYVPVIMVYPGPLLHSMLLKPGLVTTLLVDDKAYAFCGDVFVSEFDAVALSMYPCQFIGVVESVTSPTPN